MEDNNIRNEANNMDAAENGNNIPNDQNAENEQKQTFKEKLVAVAKEHPLATTIVGAALLTGAVCGVSKVCKAFKVASTPTPSIGTTMSAAEIVNSVPDNLAAVDVATAATSVADQQDIVDTVVDVVATEL